MTFEMKKLPLLVVPLATAIGLAGFASANADTLSPAQDFAPYHCEIASRDAGQMVALESRVFANQAIEGEYRLEVSSAAQAGTAQIRQGGYFSAEPGEMVSLGSVMLGQNGAGYFATLEITSSDLSFHCDFSTGGRA